MILAPMFRRRADETAKTTTTQATRDVVGFRSVYVWAEQQTTGNELPQIGSVTGDPSVYLERLEAFIRANGIARTYSAEIGPAKGMAEKGKIT